MLNKSYSMESIGNRVETEMRAKGYTFYSFSKDGNGPMNITRQTLSDKCNCKNGSCFSLDELVEIANILGVSVSYLLCEENYKNKENTVIGEKLGLFEEVIDRISEYNSAEKSMLNSIVHYRNKKNSKDYLKEILNAMYQYKLLTCSNESSIVINNPSYGYKEKFTQKEEIENYLKFNAINVFEKSLEEDYWITDFVSGYSDEMYLYKNKPRKSKIRKAEKELKQEIAQKSKKKK